MTPVTLPETPQETSPGPCNTWSMSQEPEAREAASGPEDLDPEVLDPEGPPELERRLQAMEAARPGDAPTLGELAEACSWEAERLGQSEPARAALSQGEIEAAQLMAFEGGEENWWIATGRDAGEGAGDPSVNPDALEEGA